MSTFDRRRIQAPEQSRPLVYDTPSEAGPSRLKSTDESEEIFLKTGLITQANGSAYIESGRVKIACSVYGPRPKAPPYSPKGSLNVELKFAPFASDPRRAPLRDTEPAALSAILTQLLLPTLQLHLLPKSSVDVFLLVLESDAVADVLSASLTAASAAVADAGIPISGLGVGVVQTGGGSDAGDGIDANMDDTAGRKAPLAQVTLGVMPALGRVTSLWMTGSAEVDEVCDIIDKAIVQSKNTHTVVAQAVLEGAEAAL